MIPAKAGPEAQAIFLAEQMGPGLVEAKAGKRTVFFVDARFVLVHFLGFLGSIARVFIQAPAGRHHINVLGTHGTTTHELITVTNEPYITTECLCELKQKMSDMNLTIPITLSLDNAC